MNAPRNVTSYIEALETVSAQNINELLNLCAPDVEFHDPFNHTFNRDNYRKVMVHMLDQVTGLQFNVLHHWTQENLTVMKWRFTGKVRYIGELDIPGLSEVEFDDRGLVKRHIDYWDANEHVMCKLPMIGSLIRLAMRPMII